MAPSKSKKRARSPSFHIDSGSDGGHAEEDLLMPKKSRAASPRRGKAGETDNWDSWQDSVRVQEADRVKQYVGSFQKQLQDAKTKAVQSLQRSEEKRLKAKETCLNKVQEACGEDPRPFCNTASGKDTQPHLSHPLYTAGREVLGLLHDIIARYDQANAELTSIHEQHAKAMPDAAAWDKDRAEARTLLRYGRAYGDSLVRQIIVPGHQDEAASPSHDLSPTGKSAIGLFPQSRAALAGGETWGETARTQVQALTELALTIPTDVEMESARKSTAGDTGPKSVSFADL